MVSESLKSLSFLYLTPREIEGKSPETLRSYAKTLKLFMRVVECFHQTPLSMVKLM